MTLIMEASACTSCGEARMHARACKKKKKPWGSRWVQGGVVPLTPLLPNSKARLEIKKTKKKNRPANVDLDMKAGMQGHFPLQ